MPQSSGGWLPLRCCVLPLMLQLIAEECIDVKVERVLTESTCPTELVFSLPSLGAR